MMQWYVVHTQPAAEAKAAAHLERQGYPVYLPRHRRAVRHARRRTIVLRPLFPRYLFVGIDRATMGWRPVRSTVGVAGIVCGGSEPVAVGDDVIGRLRQREHDGGFDELAPHLAPGDAVRLGDGPLAAFVGELSAAGADERVVVLLEFLGRTVRADVSGALLEAA